MEILKVMECPICMDTFTLDVITECPWCNYSMCVECLKKYIISIPECIECKVKFNYHTLTKLLPRDWMMIETPGSYIHSLKVYYLKREKSQISKILLDIVNSKPGKKIKSTNVIIRCPGDCHGMLCGNFDYDLLTKLSTTPTAKLSTTFECCICDIVVCSRCLVIINKLTNNTDHVCNFNDIKSVAEIMNSTKKCPGCGSRIQKNDGCDQMWCTMCHISFSWEYGTLDTGTIHNPHAIKWYRENGKSNDPRLLGNSGGERILINIHHLILMNIYPNEVLVQSIYSIIAQTPELIRDTMINIDLKLEYINQIRKTWVLGGLTDLIFINNIYKTEKEISVLNSYVTILRTLLMVGTELFNDLYIVSSKIRDTNLTWAKKNTYDFIEKLENFRLYVNLVIKNELSIFKLKFDIPKIIKDGEWRWINSIISLKN